MTDEYVTYNGIPHKVLPPKQEPSKETKSALDKQLELQRAILNPQDSWYILGSPQRQKEEKLIGRSASSSSSTTASSEKRLTVEKALELQQKILNNR